MKYDRIILFKWKPSQSIEIIKTETFFLLGVTINVKFYQSICEDVVKLSFCSELITSSLLWQVWISGLAHTRLRRHIPGAGQDAPLRQAQHFL